eukprot:SAG31_NODE_14769_length_788_cov_1.487663_1_plen_90_part_00
MAGYPARFSWALAHTERGQAQTAYQIVVKNAKAEGGIFWDSGKTASNVSQNVPIGATLQADSAYTWTVKCACAPIPPHPHLHLWAAGLF